MDKPNQWVRRALLRTASAPSADPAGTFRKLAMRRWPTLCRSDVASLCFNHRGHLRHLPVFGWPHLSSRKLLLLVREGGVVVCAMHEQSERDRELGAEREIPRNSLSLACSSGKQLQQT